MPETDAGRPPTAAERLVALVEKGRITMPPQYSCDARGVVYHDHGQGDSPWDQCNFSVYDSLDRQMGKLPEGERVDLFRIPQRLSCDCVFVDISVGGRGVTGYITREQFDAYQRGELVVHEAEDDWALVAMADAKTKGREPYPTAQASG